MAELNLHNLEGRLPRGRSWLSHDLCFHELQRVRLQLTHALDIADTAAIQYPVLRVDDVDDGDESTGEAWWKMTIR